MTESNHPSSNGNQQLHKLDYYGFYFAFAKAYNEQGRDYYHRISRNYAGYDQKECDEQYTKCLNAKGHGIAIATFYHYAHQAGIKPQRSQPEVATSPVEDATKEQLAMFTDSLYDTIPDFLKQVVIPANGNEERDIMLLGALTAFSACFPNLFGIYDERKVYSNLYLFVTAPASAGKGKLNQIKKLVAPIHKLHREQAKNTQTAIRERTCNLQYEQGQE